MTKESDAEWDPYAGGCPSRDVLHRIGDKWTVLVLGEPAESGARRFTYPASSARSPNWVPLCASRWWR